MVIFCRAPNEPKDGKTLTGYYWRSSQHQLTDPSRWETVGNAYDFIADELTKGGVLPYISKEPSVRESELPPTRLPRRSQESVNHQDSMHLADITTQVTSIAKVCCAVPCMTDNNLMA
jgi:hypothetical protein